MWSCLRGRRPPTLIEKLGVANSTLHTHSMAADQRLFALHPLLLSCESWARSCARVPVSPAWPQLSYSTLAAGLRSK
eukprot:2146700-Pyramimonas_sp.AAC.1